MLDNLTFDDLVSDRRAHPKVEVRSPELTIYIDYRKYLKDYYLYRQSISGPYSRKYSYSDFAASADIKSPQYLKLIIEGQRNLSDSMAIKFAKALNFNKAKSNEFITLVKFNQSYDQRERTELLKQLVSIRIENIRKNKNLKIEDIKKFPNWLRWLLLAMNDQKNIRFDVDHISNVLMPKVPRQDLVKAIYEIKSSGYVSKDFNGEGTLARLNRVKELRPQFPEQVRQLQEEFICLGIEQSIVSDEKDQHFENLAVKMTPEEFTRFKFEVRKLRKKWLGKLMASRSSSKGDRVYHLNMQLFPISKKMEPVERQAPREKR